MPNIFEFTCYRDFLSRYMETLKQNGISARTFARDCGITSPNFFQQVIAKKRNLTSLTAGRVGIAIGLNKYEIEYLHSLIKLSKSRTNIGKENTLLHMRQLIRKSQRIEVDDSELYSVWTNPIVWELQKTKHKTADAKAIVHLLRNIATEPEIASSLSFHQSRARIDPEIEKNTPPTIDFKFSNDIRRIDLQRSHLRFLQIAQHRLNDSIHEREFQGLTVAVKKEALTQIKPLLREFIQKINDQFAVDKDGDDVLRIQLCAFKITK